MRINFLIKIIIASFVFLIICSIAFFLLYTYESKPTPQSIFLNADRVKNIGKHNTLTIDKNAYILSLNDTRINILEDSINKTFVDNEVELNKLPLLIEVKHNTEYEQVVKILDACSTAHIKDYVLNSAN